MSNHVVLRGNGFACLNCGQSYEPAVPCPTNIWAASAKTFDKDHRRCKAPDVPVCGFCRAADHDDEGHVVATVKHPKDWPSCGDTGLSSKSIWQHMTGLTIADRWSGSMSYPLDPDDFGRCYRLLSAPWAAEWRTRIGEMAKYPGWAGLVARWDELEALYREERPAGKAPKLYAAMQEALGR
jgi:hypothetical protein